jgi:hypothetical protein
VQEYIGDLGLIIAIALMLLYASWDILFSDK